MSTRPRLALIEDDPDQRESLLIWLRLKGYPVWAVESAEAFYKQAVVNPVDIIIIDLGLPGEDGLQTIQHLRESTRLGIIIVSARSHIQDRMQGMQLGADQYLVKPIIPDELMLYIEALWQRIVDAASSQGGLPAEPTRPVAAWLLLEQQLQLQTPKGMSIALTPSELLILTQLIEHQTPMERKALALTLGGNPRSYDMHRIDAHLSRLRRKLKQVTDEPLPILSLPGSRLQLTETILRQQGPL